MDKMRKAPSTTKQRQDRPDDLLDTKAKRATDTARYEALAREHGADLSEEGFNEALRKAGRSKPIVSKIIDE